MNKTRIKIALIALCVIGCFAYTVTTLLRALNAPYEAEKSAVSIPVTATQHTSSDLPKVQMRNRSGMSSHAHCTIYNVQSPMSNVQSPNPLTTNPLTSNPFTIRLSSAKVHSIGGGGSSVESRESRVESNIQSTISNAQYGTAVPLLAVNTSAWSVNRDLTETDGESVAGIAARRIAPPDDGGSNIGGPGNIAPPGDEGELLGSPIGEMPILFIGLLGIVYGVVVPRIRRLRESSTTQHRR